MKRTTIDNLTVGELRAVLNWGEQGAQERARQGWLAGRDAVCREASDAAIAEHRDEGEPAAHAAARKAAAAARLRYERTHPLPPGLPQGQLAEQPSLAHRIGVKVGLVA